MTTSSDVHFRWRLALLDYRNGNSNRLSALIQQCEKIPEEFAAEIAAHLKSGPPKKVGKGSAKLSVVDKKVIWETLEEIRRAERMVNRFMDDPGDHRSLMAKVGYSTDIELRNLFIFKECRAFLDDELRDAADRNCLEPTQLKQIFSVIREIKICLLMQRFGVSRSTIEKVATTKKIR